VSKPKRLADVQGGSSHKKSAIDLLPQDVVDQLIEARTKRTHSSSQMIAWLHDEDFDGQYLHITKTMLDSWFLRKGHSVVS
jgi:hypothetical protein